MALDVAAALACPGNLVDASCAYPKGGGGREQKKGSNGTGVQCNRWLTHTLCGKTSGDQTRGTTSVKTKASEGRALVTETISSRH